MQFSNILLAAASLAVVQAVSFTNSAFNGVTAGQSFTFTWTDASGPVTINLKNGPSTDLKTVSTITSGQSGTSYVWAVPATLTADTYAFEILDNTAVPNYSSQFQLIGGAAASASSSVSSALSSASASASSVISSVLSSVSSSASLSSVASSASSVLSSITAITNATTTASSSVASSTGSSNSTVTTAKPSGTTSSSTLASSASKTASSSSSASSSAAPNANSAAEIASPLALVFLTVAALISLN